MELHTNSSNNTIFADADGDIAYFHANFIPEARSEVRLDQPVDGSDPATEWQGLLSVDETPGLLNPAEWLALQHATTGRGPRPASSPKKRRLSRRMSIAARGERRAAFTRFGAREQEGLHAESLIAAAYDSYLPEFESRSRARQGVGPDAGRAIR